MADVWLFGTFYCGNSNLDDSKTADRTKAKWRSQVKVPQGSQAVMVFYSLESGRPSFLEISLAGSATKVKALYISDLEYQLRNTEPRVGSLYDGWIRLKRVASLNHTQYITCYRLGTQVEYQEVVINPDPGGSGGGLFSNPPQFPKPIKYAKELSAPEFVRFAEERLELGYDYGVVGGMAFDTEIVVTANDGEQRNALRYLPLGRWQLGDRLILESSMEQINEVSYLQDFHRDRHGSYEGFRFKDWSDYQAIDEIIAVGDGEQQVFQLRKSYRVGDAVFYRPIVKPVVETVVFSFDLLPAGVSAIGISIFDDTGHIHLVQPLPEGAILRATFEFDVPVWFESDQIGYRLEGYQEDTNEAIYRLESVFVAEARTGSAFDEGMSIDPWVGEPVLQPTEPLDLGIIYDTSEQHNFSTSKLELKSGWVKRSYKRFLRRISFNLGSRNYDRAELNQILAYFWLARGQLATFRFVNLGLTYTARFASDQLNIKFEGADSNDAIFSVDQLKLQAISSKGLLKYLTPSTHLYFVADPPLLYVSTALNDAYEEFKEILVTNGGHVESKIDLLASSDERWLTIPVYYPQPKALYVIITAEAAPVYHSTTTFTPATTTFDQDRANYIAEFANRNFCKVIVINIAEENTAYDIFNGQLFAAEFGELGYSPALKDYGLETVFSVRPNLSANDWLNYFLGEKDLPKINL